MNQTINIFSTILFYLIMAWDTVYSSLSLLYILWYFLQQNQTQRKYKLCSLNLETIHCTVVVHWTADQQVKRLILLQGYDS